MQESKSYDRDPIPYDEILRRGLAFGKLYTRSLLKLKIDVDPDSNRNLSKYMDHPKEFREVQQLALILRDLLEWQIWSSRTAFPYVKDQVDPGEPLGQCLVSSRLAQNYFYDSRLVEVQVRQTSGNIVGPHVVLELPISVKGEGDERGIIYFYLDLTSDQILALGEQTMLQKTTDYASRINLVERDAEDSPYIFVRYQDDSDLAKKKSHPLEHSSLLLEMFAFRYRSELIEGLERFAKDLSSASRGLPEPINSRVIEATKYLNGFKKNLKMDTMTPVLQIGVIAFEEFLPSPEWLWEVSGLRGYTEALLINEGSPQALYFFVDGKIFIINFFGSFSEESLIKLTEILSPENKQMKILYAPSNLFAFLNRKGFTGPLMVR